MDRRALLTALLLSPTLATAQRYHKPIKSIGVLNQVEKQLVAEYRQQFLGLIPQLKTHPDYKEHVERGPSVSHPVSKGELPFPTDYTENFVAFLSFVVRDLAEPVFKASRLINTDAWFNLEENKFLSIVTFSTEHERIVTLKVYLEDPSQLYYVVGYANETFLRNG